MFGRTREDDRRFVGASRVTCPLRRADVDLEVCMACARLQRFVRDDPPYVTCSALPEDVRTADLHLL